MQAQGMTWGVARSLMGLGNVAFTQGDLGSAQTSWERSLAAFRSLADDRAVANVLANLGALAAQRGQLAQARAFYDEGQALARHMGLRQLSASTACNIGELALDQHNLALACASFKDGLATAFELGEQVIVSCCLDGLAQLCLRTSRAASAARLFASGELLRETIGSPLSAVELERHERSMTTLQAQLDRDAFAHEWAQGRVAPLERIVAQAMMIEPAPALARAPGRPDPAGLTPREIEVLRLVAQGLSDRGVAKRLRISPATVSKHVANLLGKTALKNRVELTLWALENGRLVAPAAVVPRH